MGIESVFNLNSAKIWIHFGGRFCWLYYRCHNRCLNSTFILVPLLRLLLLLLLLLLRFEVLRLYVTKNFSWSSQVIVIICRLLLLLVWLWFIVITVLGVVRFEIRRIGERRHLITGSAGRKLRRMCFSIQYFLCQFDSIVKIFQ